MKNDIKDTDIYWEMDWSDLNEDGTRKYPNKPEKELEFESGFALAHLIINEVVIINEYWWKKEWPNDAKQATALGVNCNDIFAWGCSDAEEMFYDDIKDVYDHWKKDPVWGTAVWCMKKRNQLPQQPVYNLIKKDGIWDLDSMGLEKNHYDEMLKKTKEIN